MSNESDGHKVGTISGQADGSFAGSYTPSNQGTCQTTGMLDTFPGQEHLNMYKVTMTNTGCGINGNYTGVAYANWFGRTNQRGAATAPGISLIVASEDNNYAMFYSWQRSPSPLP